MKLPQLEDGDIVILIIILGGLATILMTIARLFL